MKTKKEKQAQAALAAIFPGRAAAKKPAQATTLSANRELREHGMLPVKLSVTVKRFKELGIAVEKRDDARVVRPGGGSEVTSWWAPRWAVLVSEASPCNDAAIDAALVRGARDAEFAAAIDTIGSLADVKRAREKVADYIMEFWEPGE